MRKKVAKKQKQLIHRINADTLAGSVGKVNYTNLQNIVKSVCGDKRINSVQLIPVDEQVFTEDYTLLLPIAKEHLRAVIYAGIYPNKSFSPKTKFAEFAAAREECLLVDPSNAENNKIVKVHYITIFFVYIYHTKYHESEKVIEVAHDEVKSIIESQKKQLKN